MALLLRKKLWQRVPIRFSGGEHIFRLIETQQRKEDLSMVEKFSFESICKSMRSK